MSASKEKKPRKQSEKVNIPLSIVKVERVRDIEKEHFQNIERRFRYLDRIEKNDSTVAVKIRKYMYYVKTPYSSDEIRAMNQEEFDKLRRIIYHKFYYYDIRRDELSNYIEKHKNMFNFLRVMPLVEG